MRIDEAQDTGIAQAPDTAQPRKTGLSHEPRQAFVPLQYRTRNLGQPPEVNWKPPQVMPLQEQAQQFQVSSKRSPRSGEPQARIITRLLKVFVEPEQGYLDDLTLLQDQY